MKSETFSLNPVESALAQAALDNATSLTPDFQTEIDYRLRMVSAAVEHLALTFRAAEINEDDLNPGALWGVARLISYEIKIICGLHGALQGTLIADAKGQEVRR